MYLIGSQAAKLNSLKFLRKINVNEYDMIATRDEYDEFKSKRKVLLEKESKIFPGHFELKTENSAGVISHFEIDATGNLSNQMLSGELEKIYPPGNFSINGQEIFKIPHKYLLYAIKRAHANFDIHFEKTISDVIAMKRADWDQAFIGVAFITPGNTNPHTFQTPFEKFYTARHEEARAIYGKKQERIKLNKSNDDFFKAGADLRVYVHDDLHKAIAYFPGYPMFVRSKRDPNSAKMDRDLFDKLDWKFRIYTAMEESMVLALERVYIPEVGKGRKFNEVQIKSMYRYGVKKMISVSKNWFQDFAINNILEIMEPEWNFVEKFEQGLADRVINFTPEYLKLS